MYNLRLCLLGVFILSVLGGCQGGRPPLTDDQQVSLDASETAIKNEVFMFAETPFMNIDSDLLAEQLEIDQLPRQQRVIDSVTAQDAVYNMLLDSLLGEDSKNFDLKAEDTALFEQFVGRRRERMLRLLYIYQVKDKVDVTDSAVLATYEEYKESFTAPEKYKARHLVIAGHVLQDKDSVHYGYYTEDQMDSIARERAGELRNRLLDGASFDTLAMMYSHDPRTKDAGGDLGYFQIEEMIQPFDSAIIHTPLGKISGLIKTIYGWHVLRVEEIVPPHTIPLDSVSAGIKQNLESVAMQVRGQELIDSIVASGVLVPDSAFLVMPDSELERSMPIAYVNPEDTLYGRDTVQAISYLQQVYQFKTSRGITGELDLEQKTELLNSVAVKFHLLRAARILGYDRDEETKKWAENLYRRYSVSIMRRQLLEDNYAPTDEEFQAYYDAHGEDYKIDRPIYVQHIIFSDSSLALHVRDVLESGADFLEVADQYYPGDPEIRRAAADLGYIGERDMPPEFYRAAMRTPKGSISMPVKTEFGYHLIRVVEKQLPLDLEKAKIKIKPILMKQHKRQKIMAFVEPRLGRPPLIHWDKLGDLYRKVLPRPTAPFQSSGG